MARFWRSFCLNRTQNRVISAAVLFADFQLDGWESLFFSNSQHSSSGLARYFFLQCLQIGALLYFLCLSSLFFCFLLFDWLLGTCWLLGACWLFFIRDIISLIALVVLLIRVFIWRMWFWDSAAVSSSIALACSSMLFALNFFAVSLFCLFSFAYSNMMKVLMFTHVFWAAGFCSYSLTAASNLPDTFKK
jgi:hypothetical protein